MSTETDPAGPGQTMARLINGPAHGMEIPDRGKAHELIRCRDGQVVNDEDGLPRRLPDDETLAAAMVRLEPPRSAWRQYARQADGSYLYAQWRGPRPGNS